MNTYANAANEKNDSCGDMTRIYGEALRREPDEICLGLIDGVWRGRSLEGDVVAQAQLSLA